MEEAKHDCQSPLDWGSMQDLTSCRISDPKKGEESAQNYMAGDGQDLTLPNTKYPVETGTLGPLSLWGASIALTFGSPSAADVLRVTDVVLTQVKMLNNQHCCLPCFQVSLTPLISQTPRVHHPMMPHSQVPSQPITHGLARLDIDLFHLPLVTQSGYECGQ